MKKLLIAAIAVTIGLVTYNFAFTVNNQGKLFINPTPTHAPANETIGTQAAADFAFSEYQNRTYWNQIDTFNANWQVPFILKALLPGYTKEQYYSLMWIINDYALPDGANTALIAKDPPTVAMMGFNFSLAKPRFLKVAPLMSDTSISNLLVLGRSLYFKPTWPGQN